MTWTPADLTDLYAWYAADQQAEADGAEVVTLTDQSGNGRDFARSGSTGPAMSAAFLNGKNVIHFNGHYFEHDNTFLAGLTGAAIFIVAKSLGNGTGFYGGMDNNGQLSFTPYDDGDCYVGFGSNSRHQFTPAPLLTSDFFIWSEHTAANDWGVRINGVGNASSGTSTAGWGNGTRYIGGSVAYNGYIAEIIVCGDKPTDDDRDRIEGYLAWKYGLEALLPPGHPYAEGAPTVTTVRVSQARALAVADAGKAGGIDIPEARGLAVINYPAFAIEATEARALTVGTQPAKLHASQARVLVVARGRFDRPRVSAWTFTLDGHDFYVLQTIEETMVCDLTTGQWHVWGTGDAPKWRVNTGITWQRSLAVASQYGSNIVCMDDTLGALYILNPEGVTDQSPDPSRDAIPFQRIVYGQIPLTGRDSVPCYGLTLAGSIGEQLDANYVSVTLRTSDDQGHTFFNHGSLDVNPGDYEARIDWDSLGQMEAPGRLFMIEDYGAFVRIDSMEVPDAES